MAPTLCLSIAVDFRARLASCRTVFNPLFNQQLLPILENKQLSESHKSKLFFHATQVLCDSASMVACG